MMTVDSPIPPLRPVETIPVKQDGEDYLVLRDPQGFSEGMIAVAIGAVPILARLDGQHTAQQITEIVLRDHGLTVDPDQVISMVEMLENAHLLHSETFQKHLIDVEDKYRADTIRQPVLTDGGYPEDPAELTAFLHLLEQSPPPEDFAPARPRKGKRLRGFLAPHIDFQRGGRSYGRLYKQISKLLPAPEDGPLLIVIIGVAHNGVLAPIVSTRKDFHTPFGDFRFDRTALQILEEHLGESVLREELAHKSEHSVEIQIPWLQYVLKNREVTFLPILAGVLDAPKNGAPNEVKKVVDAVNALRAVEEAHSGPVIYVASVDLAHAGPAFGDPGEVNDGDCSIIERKDMKALRAIESTDPEAWWKELMSDDNARLVCGINATYLTLSMLAGCKGRVLDYQQSLSDDRTTLVSYATAIFQDA
jgi:MEMO1 family protein